MVPLHLAENCLVGLRVRPTVRGDLLCPVQGVDGSMQFFSKRKMVYAVGEVVGWKNSKVK